MEFKEKIDKILKIKRIKIWKLDRDSGMKSTLQKAYDGNRPMSKRSTLKFLKNSGVNPKWWETQKGEVLIDSTPEIPDIDRVYRDVIEGKTEYILVHRTVAQRDLNREANADRRIDELLSNLTKLTELQVQQAHFKKND